MWLELWSQIATELKAAPFSRQDSRESVGGRSLRNFVNIEDCEEKSREASKIEYLEDREARYREARHREATKGEHPEDRKMKQRRESYKGEAAVAEEGRHFEEEMSKSRTTSQVGTRDSVQGQLEGHKTDHYTLIPVRRGSNLTYHSRSTVGSKK
jgi:hypothetical protein